MRKKVRGEPQNTRQTTNQSLEWQKPEILPEPTENERLHHGWMDGWTNHNQSVIIYNQFLTDQIAKILNESFSLL